MSERQERSEPVIATKTAGPSESEAPGRRLDWFRDDATSLDVRPAPQERAWMNATTDRMAYRCPPVSTANTYGWEILNPVPFYAIWNGGKARSDIAIYCEKSDGEPLGRCGFGNGTITFPVRGLVRTEPGYDLYVSGPVNRPKPNIHAMAGIVAADWYWQEFSVTWMFTRPNELVRFEKGEPFCAFFPIQRGLIETFEPRFREPEYDPVEWQNYRERMDTQLRWNEAAQVKGSTENAQLWHRNYLRGPNDPVEPPHRIRTKLEPFKY